MANWYLLFPALFAFAQMPQSYSAPRLDSWKVIGPGGGGAQFNPTVSPVNPNLALVNCDMTGAYISEDGGDTWRMFNLRGVVRFFVPDPLDANIIYAATEGLYRSKDKGRTWALLYPKPEDVTGVAINGDHAEESILTRGNEKPRVDALAVDPADSSKLFAVISSGKTAKLYESSDGGGAWRALADVPLTRKIYLDPESARASRTLYVVGENRISIFENGTLRTEPAIAGVERFLDISAGFEKGQPEPFFYAVSGIDWRGGESGVTGLFTSRDGGANWQTVSTDFLSAAPANSRQLELRAVATSLSHPETAYLSFHDHSPAISQAQQTMGVAKTSDAGQTWQIVWQDREHSAAKNVQDPWIVQRFGPAWGDNPFAFGVSPNNPDLCFATDFGRTTRTRDGGKTWRGVYSQRLSEGVVTTTGLDVLTTHGIHFDPFDPDHWLVSFTDIGMFESRAGDAWREATSRGIPDDWQNTSYWVVFDPKIRGRVWAVVSDTHDLPRPKMFRRAGTKSYQGGVVISEDGGRSWRPSSDGMTETAPTHILLDANSGPNSRTLYVTAFGRGVYKSVDGGKHWLLKNQGIEGSEPFVWRLAQDSRGTLYLLLARRSEDGSIGNAQDGALYRSRDGAEHWEKLALPQGCNGPNGIAIDPKDDQRLYLAAWGRKTHELRDTGGGIFVSSDAGKSWRHVLEKDQHVFDVTIDLRNPETLYATGFESSVWKSVDRGENWLRVRGYNFKWGQRVIVDPKNAGMIYVCTYGGAIWHGPAETGGAPSGDIVTEVMRPGH